MQTLGLRVLAVKSSINASIPCGRLPERVALISTHTRAPASYSIVRSVHAKQEEHFEADSAMDAQKKPDVKAGAKTSQSHGEDMADSFGDGYSTRSSDEGFGQRYSEDIKFGQTLSEGAEVQHHADTHVEIRREYDQSQGSEVKEKEKGRHATEHTAFPGHNRSTPGGVGGTDT